MAIMKHHPVIIGIRHHSPACARLVAHVIAREQPAAVLIEGPCDFNARMGELLLPHQLPVALYSYAKGVAGTAQCWFPLTGYSPEWVALQQGHAIGAQVRFMDLPHWQTRALADTARRHELTAQGRLAPGRHGRIRQALGERLHVDGSYALWDHLFEAQQPGSEAEFAALRERLDVYFHDVRGDPATQGSEQDAAREAHMARWLAWAARRFDGRVLVVCGGWHKRALEALWPLVPEAEAVSEPDAPNAPDAPDAPDASDSSDSADAPHAAAGTYLVPYEYRQLEALAGYAAGMQSPLYYQWLHEEGAQAAAARASRAIVQRLRQRQVAASTADFLAFQTTLTGLARLRGHAAPLRHDVLDAAQSAFVKEALSQPAPWQGDGGTLTLADHPTLREALLALTGEARGKLAAGTPLPPLVADVAARLRACGITPPDAPTAPQGKVLDRRRAADTLAAQTLWQLKLIGAQGVALHAVKAPHAARGLRPELAFEEHWQISHNVYWLPSLIEAAAHGATLDAAARACLRARLTPPARVDENGNSLPPLPPDAAEITGVLIDAIRAGFADLGDELARALTGRIPALREHGEAARAAQALLDVALAGFWGQHTLPVLRQALAALAGRLLWLLDGLDFAPPAAASSAAPVAAQGNAPATLDDDVAAIRALGGLLRLAASDEAASHENAPLLDTPFTLSCLLRWARDTAKPPALRGAAAGLAHTQARRYATGQALDADELVALARAVPPREQLGDFLYGLFALTREVMQANPALAQAMHEALAQMGDEDFLVALPRLRDAFGWFPPRERGHIAAQVAALLGLAAPQQAALRQRLTRLPEGQTLYLQARQIEARALAWAKACGLMQWLHE